jgi:hypothetical protein
MVAGSPNMGVNAGWTSMLARDAGPSVRHSGISITQASQLSPLNTRGHFGAIHSRPLTVQWSLRTGAASPHTVSATTTSPRATSCFDQSFSRSTMKFSPTVGLSSPRDPLGAAAYDHQRFGWNASRLSVVSPLASGAITPLDAVVGSLIDSRPPTAPLPWSSDYAARCSTPSSARGGGHGGSLVSSLASSRSTFRPKPAARTIDFWQ